MKNRVIYILLSVIAVCGCDVLEPYPNGSYNEDNYQNYPEVIRGFIDKAYNNMPKTYVSNERIGSDAMTDDAVYADQSNALRQFSVGSSSTATNPFSAVWTRSYQTIYYCNSFLKDDIGYNTHYLLDADSDAMLRRTLKGDAYAMRAWSEYELLKTFGGIGTNGQMLGVPLVTTAIEFEKLDPLTVRRASFDDTVQQILRDCDSAYVYLPENNRDYPGDPQYVTPVIGSVRYRTFDRVNINCLRALTYLLWASPAFNSGSDLSRYRQAAEYASLAINHKVEKEGTLGFNPKERFLWSDSNSPEIFWVSNETKSSAVETMSYPKNFGGEARINPTQDLVDAFPDSKGYPITESSLYDPKKPYENRDPRFYATIFYNGSMVMNGDEITYKFQTYKGGKDAPYQTNTGVTSYFLKKFISLSWNPYASTVVVGYKSIFFIRWEQMLLVFAEAANMSDGPTTTINGLTAKQALQYLRSRNTNDDTQGIGASGTDAYLDLCAGDKTKFTALVKNEWRLATCFEGARYFNLRRWGDLSAINVEVHGVAIENVAGGSVNYTKTSIETKSFPSLWNPLPISDLRRCKNMYQNKGWEKWK